MVSINLLPWRAARRDYRMARLKTGLGGVLLLAGVLLIITYCFLIHRNQQLSRDYHHLQVRMQTQPAPRTSHREHHWHTMVQQWRAQQRKWTAWLIWLNDGTTASACLQSLHIGEQHCSITGFSASLDALQHLMKTWRVVQGAPTTQSTQLKAQPPSGLLHFEVNTQRDVITDAPQEIFHARS